MLQPTYINLWMTTYAVKQTLFLHIQLIPTLRFSHQVSETIKITFVKVTILLINILSLLTLETG
jgi:hypothetical protein